MTIGERIVKLRTAINLSQYQLAKAMEVSRQAVSKWENGQAIPDSAKMIRLSEVLNTDLEYLTTGRNVVPSRPPVVVESVKTVEKIVEKPVVQVVEKIVERKVEVPVEVPVIEYVEKPVVKIVYRNKYLRNPIEYVLAATAGIILGNGAFFFGDTLATAGDNDIWELPNTKTINRSSGCKSYQAYVRLGEKVLNNIYTYLKEQ